MWGCTHERAQNVESKGWKQVLVVMEPSSRSRGHEVPVFRLVLFCSNLIK